MTAEPPAGDGIAVITGASRGIGLAIASRLAGAWPLVLVGRDAEGLEAARGSLPAAAQAELFACDLALAAGRAAVIEALAGRPVAVLVNNAGVASAAPLAKTDDALWAQTLELNLRAPFELIRAWVPAMAARGFGRVVNVASSAALKGYRYTAAYSASKAGLVGLTRALAIEFASKGVTINAVCPGFVDTRIAAEASAAIASATGRTPAQARAELARFNPQGRLLAPAEVADLVGWLCSEQAAGVSGQAWAIDGGETA